MICRFVLLLVTGRVSMRAYSVDVFYVRLYAKYVYCLCVVRHVFHPVDVL